VIVPRPGSSVTRNPSPPWPDWPAVACASWPRAAAAHPQPAVLHRRGTLFHRHGPARCRPAGRASRSMASTSARHARTGEQACMGATRSAAANWPSASAISARERGYHSTSGCAAGRLRSRQRAGPGARR
jgi:hypothetical protein